MAEIIANDFSAFDTSISDFSAAYKALVNDFDEVVKEMDSLNGMWTGQAHDALLERFKQDKAVVRGMLDFIRDIISDLNYAESGYRRCENNVNHIVNSIRI